MARCKQTSSRVPASSSTTRTRGVAAAGGRQTPSLRTVNGIDTVVVQLDVVAVQQLLGLAAPGNCWNRQTPDRQAGSRHGCGDGIAHTARRVMVLDGDDLAAGGTPGRDESVAVHRRD